MKIRQAIKIGKNTTIGNLVTREINGTIYVVGIKNTPYTFWQFCKAYRVIRKAYKRNYNGNDRGKNQPNS